MQWSISCVRSITPKQRIWKYSESCCSSLERGCWMRRICWTMNHLSSCECRLCAHAQTHTPVSSLPRAAYAHTHKCGMTLRTYIHTCGVTWSDTLNSPIYVHVRTKLLNNCKIIVPQTFYMEFRQVKKKVIRVNSNNFDCHIASLVISQHDGYVCDKGIWQSACAVAMHAIDWRG